jgi:hypothetical protein
VDAGCGVFYKGLHLLDDPAGMYERGNETVRTILNRAIFVRSYIDGKKVVRAEQKEPFGSLDEVYRRQHARRYYRTAGWPSTHATGLLVAPDLDELEARWHDLRGGVALLAGTAATPRSSVISSIGRRLHVVMSG